ncbi:hypothetical protein K110096F8_27340 [Dielma fastidiosa]
MKLPSINCVKSWRLKGLHFKKALKKQGFQTSLLFIFIGVSELISELGMTYQISDNEFYIMHSMNMPQYAVLPLKD